MTNEETTNFFKEGHLAYKSLKDLQELYAIGEIDEKEFTHAVSLQREELGKGLFSMAWNKEVSQESF